MFNGSKATTKTLTLLQKRILVLLNFSPEIIFSIVFTNILSSTVSTLIIIGNVS